MSRPASVSTAVGGREIVTFLGGLYVVLAAGYPFVPAVGDSSPGVVLVMLVLVGGPGLVLLFGGYSLPRTDLHPAVYSVVAKWCVGGIGAMLGLLALTELAAGLRDPLQNVLILTALGSVAGFAAGVHDGRAKTRALELEETVERLQMANERLEQFAYAASHDLKEPLRMISSYLQLLERRYGDRLDEEGEEFLEFAVDNADRMQAMIDSLLEYSRVSTRGNPLEPTDTGAVLESVLDELGPQIDEVDATITVDDLPTVTGDAEQLACVFRNLLSNALKYSGDEPPRVHVSAEREADAWRFAVTDEGIGIDPEYHERVFDVFERLHGSESEPEPGAGGIGLALCERIVERHGGDIWVDSEPGSGATFFFTIPTTESQRAEQVARTASPA